MNYNYDKKKFIKDKINSYYKEKYKNINNNYIYKSIKEKSLGGFHKIYSNIKNRIYRVFKEYNIPFNMSYEEIIGCNFLELEKYINEKLDNSMNLDNYGDWEIDHIIPVSSFDFTKNENILKCFNYKNLQPLWKLDNRTKFNKINYLKNNLCE